MRGRIDPHAKYRELIAARLDKPLTRVELRTLTSHLKKCAACQTVEADYRSQRNLMRGLAEPIPPRDLWARTSASLDREVAREYRAQKIRRRVTRGTRTAGPSTAVLTAIAAVGVSAALALLQLAPAVGPLASVAPGPTPLRVSPYQLAMLGQGTSDVAIYQLDVNQVCPVSAALDCVPNQHFVRTPISLPSDIRAGNVALNAQGNQLSLVGHTHGEDVIAVVTIPQGNGSGGKTNSGKGQPTDSPAGPAQTSADKTHSPNQISDPQPVTTDAPPTDDGSDQPSAPPASAVPGLAVLSILDNVQSAGAAPDWNPDGDTLAFSAMPDDGSTGPDVYTWSPGDAKATAITTDHGSFFASWSGNRIVISRISAGSSKPHDFVIDPESLEQRAVTGPQLWLPTVNTQRTQAIGWFGQLDTNSLLPATGSGALYLMDWASVDPFGAAAPAAGSTDESDDAGAPDSSAPPANSDQQTPAPHASSNTSASAAPSATSRPASTTTPTATNSNSISDPETTQDTTPAQIPSSLIPLEADRDPGASPVIDWQARWSNDGQVLGVWIADSAGSSWGRIEVLAVDPTTGLVSDGDPLLPMTMAKRGFSLGQSQVAWVGPAADDSPDGDLRIRTWGSDGVGGLRLQAPGSDEVTPAS